MGTVNLPPYPHPACLCDEELLKHCRVLTGRRGGPGGQNRNKVETHVEIVHEPTGLSGQAGEHRSQMPNKHDALRRLRLALAVELRGTPQTKKGLAWLDEPAGSALWRSRVRGGRIILNPDHHDYPSMLAEALDAIARCDWDPSRAGVVLDTTASQLVKLAGHHAPALAKWNSERAARGLRTLRC